MIGTAGTHATAFEGSTRIASGRLQDVVEVAKASHDRGALQPILIFDDVSGHPIEIDWRGTIADTLGRLAPDTHVDEEDSGTRPEAVRGPGRPKLGVVPREITLLPRHWAWLATQPGGASVALRKLVDEAKRANEAKDRARAAQESAYRFMSAMAGNLPGFEEATRAFFANDAGRFAKILEGWPIDVRAYSMELAGRAFPVEARAE